MLESGCPLFGFLFSTSHKHGFKSYFDDLKIELHRVHPKTNIFSLIITSLRNPYMPLIRYRSGDCVETSDASNNPEKITRVCGRERELLHLSKDKCFSHAKVDDLICHHAQDIFLYQ